MAFFIFAVLVFAIVLIVMALVGVIRVIIFVAPFCVLVGLAVYAIVGNRSRRARHDAALDAIADRERELNKQEYTAWSSSVERERRNAAKRAAVSRAADKGDPSERPSDADKRPRP